MSCLLPPFFSRCKPQTTADVSFSYAFAFTAVFMHL